MSLLHLGDDGEGSDGPPCSVLVNYEKGSGWKTMLMLTVIYTTPSTRHVSMQTYADDKINRLWAQN
ncbi:hypothetical protein OUZ56_025997 [Daphnia magna]|uniref:Uncharacterized protein n=1 Tax=Daphnia magna TaxID=35525 RepID=A0ABQ9ZKJ5_9CRUS|nr:hypothetical protein OUZ56_025997 [Daphnia magna]